MTPDPHQILSATQLWALLIGSVVPLITYLINHYGPHVSEPAKAIVHVVTAGFAGGLYQALDVGHLGVNATTAQYVFTAVAGALTAHHILWKPSTISTKLGAGSNAPRV